MKERTRLDIDDWPRMELLSRESHGTVIVTRSRKQVFAGMEQIIVYRPYFTQYLLRTIMSTEKARFAQEVAEIEQWWKVRSLLCYHRAYSMCLEFALCSNQAPLYRC